ncbi:hypothetical protein [Pandoraea sputorum]|uniref:hypothetical protein n=1 Tax=Pandoraea sputorum TaxID=93222 RepID=UPI00123FB119|nr:hypothetical protein [Pandoraea sputorum]
MFACPHGLSEKIIAPRPGPSPEASTVLRGTPAKEFGKVVVVGAGQDAAVVQACLVRVVLAQEVHDNAPQDGESLRAVVDLHAGDAVATFCAARAPISRGDAILTIDGLPGQNSGPKFGFSTRQRGAAACLEAPVVFLYVARLAREAAEECRQAPKRVEGMAQAREQG